MAEWSVLTNHARVLLCIAHDTLHDAELLHPARLSRTPRAPPSADVYREHAHDVGRHGKAIGSADVATDRYGTSLSQLTQLAKSVLTQLAKCVTLEGGRHDARRCGPSPSTLAAGRHPARSL